MEVARRAHSRASVRKFAWSHGYYVVINSLHGVVRANWAGSAAVSGLGAAGSATVTGLGMAARGIDDVGSAVIPVVGEGLRYLGRGIHAFSPQNLAHTLGRGIAGAARGVAESRGFLDRVGMAVADAEGQDEDPR